MHHIPVDLGDRSYTIAVQPGLLSSLHEFLTEWNHGQTWVLITQPFLFESVGRDLERNLITHGFNAKTLVIPSGELAKSIQQVEQLYRSLLELQCDRSTTLLALGGGVVGDITGFIAATFMRGISYIQIPTTLLAMVDSAIGGKTGVNLPEGKNLVGAIHQPKMVAIDPVVLGSLPKRELVSGTAEILKYGAISDRDFYHRVVRNLSAILDERNPTVLEDIIAHSCTLKAGIVMEDELEGNRRRILNFGHTIGHALEASLGYDTLRHGEAVAYGMICAGYISYQRNQITGDDWLALQNGIKSLPLPAFTRPKKNKLLSILKRDKKIRAGVLHFILLEGLGYASIADDVGDDELLSALDMLT